ncbi:MAG: PQQ-binding-like beta-propeller repeat protein [Gemmataceae bacterium]
MHSFLRFTGMIRRFHRIGLLLLVLCVGGTAGVRAADWPQWLGPQRDGVWRETGILEKFPQGGPKVVWRTPIGGGYAGPAVANGKVFVTDRVLADGVTNPANPFARDVVTGKERILCLDEKTGKILWQHEYESKYQISYPAGPRATPVVAEGKVYTLGAMGDLLCLDANTGKVSWSKNFVRDYEAVVPMWGFAGHPLLDGDRLICLVGGDKGSLVVAFHKDTGKELWRALSSAEVGYCPPMIFEVGKRRQLIIWEPGGVHGLNPETGQVYWSAPFRIKAALSIPTPRLDEKNRLFVTSFYNGSLMLQLDPNQTTAKELWRGKGRSERQTEDLHSIMVTPIIKDGHIYGVCSYGQLRCLEADTGNRLWESLQATGGRELRWGNAFIIPHGDRYFLFNEQGELIIAQLTPKGYEEIDRAAILEPTNFMAAGQRNGGAVLWSHPAFANRCLFARNDKEIICVSLAAE